MSTTNTHTTKLQKCGVVGSWDRRPFAMSILSIMKKILLEILLNFIKNIVESFLGCPFSIIINYTMFIS